MLTKQAKILSEKQIRTVLAFIDSSSRNALRDKVIFLLSVCAGLWAKEIASLELSMITNAEAQLAEAISLQNKASKGQSGRVIAMSKTLRTALQAYLDSGERDVSGSNYLITTERSGKFSANAIAVFFNRLYKALGYEGCSSHSGRRTFITNCARKISQVGGSLRDVMMLAGHRNLATTQRYVECDELVQQKLIGVIYPSI